MKRRPASLSALAAATAFACQSLVGFEDEYRLADVDASTGGTTTDSGSDQAADNGGTSGDADAPLDLPSACKLFAQVTCKSIPLCCQKYYGGFDETVCLAAMNEQCARIESAAAKQHLNYDPSYLDECLATLPVNKTQCEATIETLLDVFDAISPCRHLFAGTLPAGDVCSDTFECADSFEPGAAVLCSSKKCVRFEKVAQGKPCSTALYPAYVCEDGTYCSKADGTFGVCLAEVPIGQNCTLTECGVGNRCDTGVCAPGLTAGEVCVNFFECASGVCRCAADTCLPAEQKKCVDVPVVDKPTCVAG